MREYLVVGLVVLALLVLIVLVLRRDRRVGRDDEQGAVLQEVGVGAQEYRRRARAHLSAGTVRNYLSAAVAKTGTSNRHEAARVARSKGWI